jgi:hypothetical protein
MRESAKHALLHLVVFPLNCLGLDLRHNDALFQQDMDGFGKKAAAAAAEAIALRVLRSKQVLRKTVRSTFCATDCDNLAGIKSRLQFSMRRFRHPREGR